MPWKFRPLDPIERENAGLRTELIKLRRELQTKRTQLGGLKLALHQRLETIDHLRGRIERLQQRNRRLDAEADRLAEMVRLSP